MHLKSSNLQSSKSVNAVCNDCPRAKRSNFLYSFSNVCHCSKFMFEYTLKTGLLLDRRTMARRRQKTVELPIGIPYFHVLP
jgi:hypothetical protein